MGRRKLNVLSPKQVETLRAIEDFLSDFGYPPSIQELSVLLSISHASAHERVKMLIRKGFLSRKEGKARGISVENKITPQNKGFVSLAILGKVAAGIPIWSEENHQGIVLELGLPLLSY